MKLRLIVLATGVALLLGYCASLQFAEREAREQADAVAVALESHQSAKGAYPQQLREIGFDDEALRARWHLVYRPGAKGDTPALFYSAQNNFLVAWHYDFRSRRWVSQD